eukprot:UN33654
MILNLHYSQVGSPTDGWKLNTDNNKPKSDVEVIENIKDLLKVNGNMSLTDMCDALTNRNETPLLQLC